MNQKLEIQYSIHSIALYGHSCITPYSDLNQSSIVLQRLAFLHYQGARNSSAQCSVN